MSKIIQNAIRIIEYNVILHSQAVHDYNHYKGYSIDGGNDYIKYSIPIGKTNDDIEFLTIMDDEPIEKTLGYT